MTEMEAMIYMRWLTDSYHNKNITKEEFESKRTKWEFIV